MHYIEVIWLPGMPGFFQLRPLCCHNHFISLNNETIMVSFKTPGIPGYRIEVKVDCQVKADFNLDI